MDAAVLGDRLPEVTQKPFLGPGSLSLQCRHWETSKVLAGLAFWEMVSQYPQSAFMGFSEGRRGREQQFATQTLLVHSIFFAYVLAQEPLNGAVSNGGVSDLDLFFLFCSFLSFVGLSWFFGMVRGFSRSSLCSFSACWEHLWGTVPKGSATQSGPFPKKVGNPPVGNPRFSFSQLALFFACYTAKGTFGPFGPKVKEQSENGFSGPLGPGGRKSRKKGPKV